MTLNTSSLPCFRTLIATNKQLEFIPFLGGILGQNFNLQPCQFESISSLLLKGQGAMTGDPSIDQEFANWIAMIRENVGKVDCRLKGIIHSKIHLDFVKFHNKFTLSLIY